ncbi:hypothetical protein F4808DRAFT_369536 [Astrocystis sublimbata]|nr:hypothetical protein F4808DRAFT_369536 [Astrocystis sublimbata]
MAKASLRCCTVLDISDWDTTRGWQHKKVGLHESLELNAGNKQSPVRSDAPICVIFASANAVRKCECCRTHLIDEFHMPKPWWTDSTRKSNGYFGCHVTSSHINTWAFFEIKQLEEGDKYRWYKLNVFIRWNKSTHQTTVLAFDTLPLVASRFLDRLATPDDDNLDCPFWFFPHLLGEVARIQERAVWAIRDRVRAVEKQVTPKGRPDPDYRILHDIARHAIHVSETLDVATSTIKRMLARHEDLMEKLNSQDEFGSQEIHSQLQFYESFISNLRCRSASNEKRMLNEIQLAFNTVAQHDASTSVKIGLATQSDSVTMKSIAFVTLTFLPPTFVSAIFSMSFFDYDAETGWAISDKFWLYWAFAVPTTVLTAVAWHFLRQYNVSTPPKEKPKWPMVSLV